MIIKNSLNVKQSNDFANFIPNEHYINMVMNGHIIPGKSICSYIQIEYTGSINVNASACTQFDYVYFLYLLYIIQSNYNLLNKHIEQSTPIVQDPFDLFENIMLVLVCDDVMYNSFKQCVSIMENGVNERFSQYITSVMSTFNMCIFKSKFKTIKTS